MPFHAWRRKKLDRESLLKKMRIVRYLDGLRTLKFADASVRLSNRPEPSADGFFALRVGKNGKLYYASRGRITSP